MRFKISGLTGLVMALLLATLIALPAVAATNMLTAAGVTAPANSTCPTGAPSGKCLAGWFRIQGAASAIVNCSATAGTNTIILEQRLSATSAVWPLQTWTNASATQAGIAVSPLGGEIHIRATAVSGGTVGCQFSASSPTGTDIW
jgi:hypothetical protein